MSEQELKACKQAYEAMLVTLYGANKQSAPAELWVVFRAGWKQGQRYA